jgi:hypothetical protein
MLTPRITHHVLRFTHHASPFTFDDDQRGSTLIQFVLVLPIFMLLILGSYELWKLVAIKQRLEAATVQATRYLMVEGRFVLSSSGPGAFPGEWEALAREIIVNQMRHDPLVGDAANAIVVRVDTPTGLAPECPRGRARRQPLHALERAQFAVTAALPVPSPLRIPFLGTAEQLVLQETHTAYLECESTSEPTPVPEP